jgi:hypothetical protein
MVAPLGSSKLAAGALSQNAGRLDYDQFVCFGLRAPANPLVIIVITLSATILSSMMFAIVDIVDPYKGLYNISSRTCTMP